MIHLPGFVASLLELVYAKLSRGTMEPGKAGHQVGPQLLCVDVQTIGHIDQLRTQLHRQQKKGRGSAAEAGFADQSLVHRPCTWEQDRPKRSL